MVEPTLEFIAQQLERIFIEQRLVREDLNNIKIRLTALESAFGLLITQIATLNGRIDQIEGRRL